MLFGWLGFVVIGWLNGKCVCSFVHVFVCFAEGTVFVCMFACFTEERIGTLDQQRKNLTKEVVYLVVQANGFSTSARNVPHEQ